MAVIRKSGVHSLRVAISITSDICRGLSGCGMRWRIAIAAGGTGGPQCGITGAWVLWRLLRILSRRRLGLEAAE